VSVSPLATLLLRRQHQVYLAPAPGRPAAPKDAELLEMRLLELGFVLTRPLAAALRALPSDALQPAGDWLVATLAADLGADRPHVPLFRRFPRWIPRDTWALYVRRVVTWLLQSPNQPCVLCGAVGTVSALNPCGHLVCHACWDGSNYSGCPICHRRIALDDPFLKPSTIKPDKGSFTGTLRPLHLGGGDLDALAGAHLQRLLARATPLSPTDREDLDVLLASLGPRAPLPPEIPVKETMAIAVGAMLRAAPAPDVLLRDLADHLRTATDVLRVLSVWMGGPADLLTRPRPLRSPPRKLRRVLLALLGRLPTHLLIEDLGRHPGLWKRVGARLHPFEDHAAHPGVAAAFAVLRATDIDPDSDLGKTLATAVARMPHLLRLDARRLRYTSWAARLEQALHTGDLPVALGQLEQRPGELLRRLDHVLREVVRRTREPSPRAAAQPDPPDASSPSSPEPDRPRTTSSPNSAPLPTAPAASSPPRTPSAPPLPLPAAAELHARLLAAVAAALPRVSPAVALTVLAHLRARARKLPRRVFFPRGDVLRAYGVPDRRRPLPADVVAPLVHELERELLRRAGERPGFARAVLDAALVDLMVPFNERTASKSLVAVPRGSSLPVPRGETLRLFVHWMESDQRVDLDLSVAFFDAKWRFVGQCDFTELTYEEESAVHSGDLTSAPPPLGASEFVDLDLDLLEVAGVAHAVAVIFSYNDVTFDLLPDAFAGFMLRTDRDGAHFDARTVEQRFDLQGRCKLAIPLTIDLAARRMRWLDVKLTDHGLYHQVAGYHAALAHLGLDFAAMFGSGARASMWDLACLHAAARAPEVVVRSPNAPAETLRRGPDEPVHTFYRRLVSAATRPAASTTAPDLAAADAPAAALDTTTPPAVTTASSTTTSPVVPTPADIAASSTAASSTAAAATVASSTVPPAPRAGVTPASATTPAADLPPLGQDPLLFAALRDDLPLPPGSVGYALRWLASTPDQVQRLAAADLLAALDRS
jgi:hypothetical protein